MSAKLKHWVTICAEPLALVRGVRESRRDGIYGNNGLLPIGRDKRGMLTRANPVGMGHIVAMDFSPLAVGMEQIVAMDFSPFTVRRSC